MFLRRFKSKSNGVGVQVNCLAALVAINQIFAINQQLVTDRFLSQLQYKI